MHGQWSRETTAGPVVAPRHAAPTKRLHVWTQRLTFGLWSGRPRIHFSRHGALRRMLDLKILTMHSCCSAAFRCKNSQPLKNWKQDAAYGGTVVGKEGKPKCFNFCCCTVSAETTKMVKINHKESTNVRGWMTGIEHSPRRLRLRRVKSQRGGHLASRRAFQPTACAINKVCF